MIKTDKKCITLAFYLTVLGIALNFETIILIFLNAYAYYPKIILHAPLPFHDVLAGNLFSQFSVSATVVFVVVFNLKFYWYLIFAGIYGLIEELFLALGIYSHHWYQTWMTVVILLLAFWLGKRMYSGIMNGTKPLVYYLYIYLGLFPLSNITLAWGLMLSGHLDFCSTLIRDPIISRFFIEIVLFNISALASMVIYYSRFRKKLSILVFGMLYYLYYIGCKQHIIWIKDGWFLLVTTLLILWMYGSVVIMDFLYQKSKYRR
ncbi:hypothetical protein [Desulfosporosinus orientis]|nr:hypothetical protein [Desulfosporosinus orientis]